MLAREPHRVTRFCQLLRAPHIPRVSSMWPWKLRNTVKLQQYAATRYHLQKCERCERLSRSTPAGAQRGPLLWIVATDDLRAGLGRHRAQAIDAGARGSGIGAGPQLVSLPERTRVDGVEGKQQAPAVGQAQQQR